MAQPVDLLPAGGSLIDGLSPAGRELLAGHATSCRFDRDAQLLRRGAAADVFYLIRTGSVALETYIPGRGAVTIETIEAGEMLGWSWLWPPHRWHLDARALTVVAATAFDGAGLRSRWEDDPAQGYELMLHFTRLVTQRLQWTRLRALDVYGER